MKRILNILLIMFIFLVVSCNLNFDSSMYYRKMNMKKNITINSDQTGLDVEDAGEIADHDDDVIQKLFDEAEKNKDAYFPAQKLQDWVLYMSSMDSDMLSTYKFKEGSWTKKDYYETYVSGINIGSGLSTTSNICYYRYKSRIDRWKELDGFNPFAGEDLATEEKLKNREKRFLFFKFTGEAAGNNLNNSLFCVDVYTKFIWNYSEPAQLKTIAGYKVPSDWVDYEAPARGSEHSKSFNKFYLYDPIGYVEEDGSVVIYPWYSINAVSSVMNLKPYQIFTDPARRSPDGQGYSPYLPANSAGSVDEIEHEPGLYIELTTVKNISIDAEALIKPNPTFNFETIIKPIDGNDYDGKSLFIPNKKEKKIIPKGASFNFNVGTLFELDRLPSYKTFKIDTAINFYANRIQVAPNVLVWHGKAALGFEYVPATETKPAYIKFIGFMDDESINPATENDKEECNLEPEEIFLTVGEKPKQVVITYTTPRKMKEAKYSTGGQIEITYTLSFKGK